MMARNMMRVEIYPLVIENVNMSSRNTVTKC